MNMQIQEGPAPIPCPPVISVIFHITNMISLNYFISKLSEDTVTMTTLSVPINVFRHNKAGVAPPPDAYICF